MTTTTEQTPFYFGAIGDGKTDDTQAWINALSWAQSVSTFEGAVGKIYCPPGFTFATSGSLGISTPIVIDCESFIDYQELSGSAFIIGQNAPTNGKNTGYDLRFAGFRASNGNSSAPTGINATGSYGIEVRNMQFSKLRIDEIIAFTGAGFYGNSTNDAYTGQQVQDNNIQLGQIAYNGQGIFTNSESNSTGAFQANDVHVQNSFANFVNLQVDMGGAANCSSSNRFRFNAMDPCASGGAGIYCYSGYNHFDLTYLGTSAIFGSTSAYNRLRCSNNFSTGASFYDGSGLNDMQTGPADSSILPANIPAQLGTAIQNGYGVPIMIYVTATISPSASGGTGFQANVGRTQGSLQTVAQEQEAPQTNAVARQSTISFMVPSMKWWSINQFGPGTVSFNSISVVPMN
jgi:hypothetical protein